MNQVYWISVIMVLLFIGVRLWDKYRCGQSAYVSPPAPPCPATAYKTYLINLPDGVVTTTNYYAYIPDYTTWSEPMTELFLLIVKDWRSWEETLEKSSVSWRLNKKVFTHKTTGIYISISRNNYYSEYTFYQSSLSLTHQEDIKVIELAKIWKDIHYKLKLERINRIKVCKRDRLIKQARSKEAQKIREYLKGVSK